MKQKLQLREMLPLLGLTVSAFIFNTSEFIPIGILSDIARAFQLTEAQAGIMITVYSWAVTILSLPLMLLASRMDFRRLLLCVIGLFGISHVLSAFAPNFQILLISRLGVASAHAIFWSIASPIAVLIVPEEHRPLAMSMVITGTSIAMILGMPLGRIIGLAFGWRMPFAVIAVITVIVFFYMLRLFPKVPGTQSFTLNELPALFKNRMLVCIYIFIALFVTGYYATYSYIEPFLKQVGGLSDELTTIVLTLFGITGLFGSFLYSKLYAKTRRAFLIVSAASIALVLYLLYPAAVMNHYLVIVLCALWGIAATAYNVAYQSELLAYAPADASAIAMAIYSAIFNLGIGFGTGLGGIVTTHVSIHWIGLVGGLAITLATLFSACMIIPMIRKQKK